MLMGLYLQTELNELCNLTDTSLYRKNPVIRSECFSECMRIRCINLYETEGNSCHLSRRRWWRSCSSMLIAH